MEISYAISVYFGQSCTAKRIATAAASVISEHVYGIDLCAKAAPARICSGGDVLVAAMPISGGRLTPAVIKGLSGLRGNGTPAVAIVLCGSGGFGDSLLELCDLLTAQGFSVIGAAAFVSQGHQRPDDGDYSKLVEFASACARALESFGGCCRNLNLPGSRPYQKPAEKSLPGAFARAFHRAERRPEQRSEPVWFI